MYIVIAILAFGVLVVTHELGHFIAAKRCGVKVLEFAVGMGPRIWHTKRGETEYSLRCLPVGGFCAMEGEDEDSEDPRAFSNQPAWKKLIILAAGSAMNFLLGFVLVGILFSDAGGYTSPVISGFFEGCPYEGTLQTGDRITGVNGERVWFSGNFSEYVTRNAPDGNIDLVLRRDGKRVELHDYHMVPVEYTHEDGSTETKYGIYFQIDPPTPLNWIKYTWYNCLDFVRLVRLGLVDLLTGNAAVSDMSGVVGIVDVINETGESAETTAEGLNNVLYLISFIAVNLAVMNMLPIPALDGGHIVTVLLSWGVEKLIGRKPDPRIEGYIHLVGLMLLMGLMLFTIYNDIARIIAR